MSGYTLRTPATVLTTIYQDAQPAGAINAQDARDAFTSSMASEPLNLTVTTTLDITFAFLTAEFNSATPVSLLIPTDAAAPTIQIGTIVYWCNLGAGILTIAAVTPGTTTVLRSVNAAGNTAVQGTSGGVRKRAANSWVLFGEIT